MESEILLSAQNISHSFYPSKTASVRALDNLSFEIRRGEIYGLVGESGSGKSTAARCVMNLVKPQSGHIFYQRHRHHRPQTICREQKAFADLTADDLSGLDLKPESAA